MKDLFELVRGPSPYPDSQVALSSRHPGGAFLETTYANLWRRVHQIADALGPARTHSFLTILARKSPDGVACMLAAMATGRGFCAPNPKYRGPQIGTVLDATRSAICATDSTGLLTIRGIVRDNPRIAKTRWLLLDSGTLTGPAADTVAQLREVASVIDIDASTPAADAPREYRGYADLDAPATCLFTSGSTGTPKGVVISAGDLRQRSAAEVAYFELTQQDVLLSVVSLSYDLGLSQLLTGLTVGAEVVLLDSWLPVDVLNAVANRRVTGIHAVPAIWHDLLRSSLRFDRRGRHASLRYITLSGGSLSRTQLETLPIVVDGADIFKTYGQQEAFRATALPACDYQRKIDSVGKPFPGVTVHVMREDGSRCEPGEPGQVIHTGLGMMCGYLGADGQIEPTAKLGANPFFGPGDPSEKAIYTGDTGYLDDEGYLYIKGRSDQMLKVMGNRVYPQEVTTQVLSLPGILDAIVVGVPREDEEGQFTLVAFLVAETDPPPTVGSLRRQLHTKLPAFMVPKQFIFVDSMPRTESGKTDAKKLVAAHGGTAAFSPSRPSPTPVS